MKKTQIIELEKQKDRNPMHNQTNFLDMLSIRYDENVPVLYGRCQHLGTLMADRYIDGPSSSLGIDQNTLQGWSKYYFTSFIGCLVMGACHTNNYPMGIATQKENLKNKSLIDKSAKQFASFVSTSNDLIKVIARSCGHDDIRKFNFNKLSKLYYNIHQLT